MLRASSSLHPFARFVCLGFLAVLAGCGGGGGGGGSDNGPPPPPPPSGLSYATPLTLRLNAAREIVRPTVSGTVTSYTVAPALPAGLTLNTPSGEGSGTPTQPAAPATY